MSEELPGKEKESQEVSWKQTKTLFQGGGSEQLCQMLQKGPLG